MGSSESLSISELHPFRVWLFESLTITELHPSRVWLLESCMENVQKDVRINGRCGYQKLDPLLNYIHFGAVIRKLAHYWSTYIFGVIIRNLAHYWKTHSFSVGLSETWPITELHSSRCSYQKLGLSLKYSPFRCGYHNSLLNYIRFGRVVRNLAHYRTTFINV